MKKAHKRILLLAVNSLAALIVLGAVLAEYDYLPEFGNAAPDCEELAKTLATMAFAEKFQWKRHDPVEKERLLQVFHKECWQ